jgi:hypothetical protein
MASFSRCLMPSIGWACTPAATCSSAPAPLTAARGAARRAGAGLVVAPRRGVTMAAARAGGPGGRAELAMVAPENRQEVAVILDLAGAQARARGGAAPGSWTCSFLPARRGRPHPPAALPPADQASRSWGLVWSRFVSPPVAADALAAISQVGAPDP